MKGKSKLSESTQFHIIIISVFLCLLTHFWRMNFIVFVVFECETKTIKPPGGFEHGKRQQCCVAWGHAGELSCPLYFQGFLSVLL